MTTDKLHVSGVISASGGILNLQVTGSACKVLVPHLALFNNLSSKHNQFPKLVRVLIPIYSLSNCLFAVFNQFEYFVGTKLTSKELEIVFLLNVYDMYSLELLFLILFTMKSTLN